MFFQRFKPLASKTPPWARLGAIVVLGTILITSVRFLWSMTVGRGAGHHFVDTSATGRPRFLWSDAWFLTALAKCDGGPAPLACVIGWGDAMNYLIITREELNGALGRLGRSGHVIRHADGTVELTAAGRALVEEGRKGSTLHNWRNRVERLLGAAPWTPSYNWRRAGEGEAELVSEAEYRAAVDRYKSDGIT